MQPESVRTLDPGTSESFTQIRNLSLLSFEVPSFCQAIYREGPYIPPTESDLSQPTQVHWTGRSRPSTFHPNFSKSDSAAMSPGELKRPFKEDEVPKAQPIADLKQEDTQVQIAEEKYEQQNEALHAPKRMRKGEDNTEHARIVEETSIRRKRWLAQNRHLFEPVLPEKNYFTRITETNLGPTVPMRLLDQPPGVKATMKDYQLRGFSGQYLRNGMSAILGDEMGLGKTLQTLSLFSHLASTHNIRGPHLVVAPLSVLSSWVAETARWTPEFRTMLFHGGVDERNRLKRTSLEDAADIYVTSYEMFVAEAGWFRTFRWRYVVLDEGHRIKMKIPLQQKPSAVCLHKIDYSLPEHLYRIIYMSFWALFHWLFPEVFTSMTVKKFNESFDLTRGMYDIGMLNNCRRLLETIMLRRMKSHVDFDIPPQEELTLYVPLSDMQALLVMTTTPNADGTVDEKHGKRGRKAAATTMTNMAPAEAGSDWKKLMNLVMQLRNVATKSEPFVTAEDIVYASSKMVLLDKLIVHLRANKHRILIFSGFTTMLDILEDFMLFRNIPYCRLDGTTSRTRRNLDIRLFQHPNSPYDVFIISTRAGGLGINLTTADTVIFFDNDWNPQVDLQALARAHRIGQTKPVKVYRALAHEEPRLSTGELMLMLRRGMRAVTRLYDDAAQFNREPIEEILRRSKERQIEVEKRETTSVVVSVNEDVPVSSGGTTGTTSPTQAIAPPAEDDFILEGMEQIKSRLFEGVTVHKSHKTIGDEWQEMKEKRARQERVVKIGAHSVLKETIGCGEWEARATFYGICHECMDEKPTLDCSLCPRAYHKKCTPQQLGMWGFVCPQHACVLCDRKAAAAGGMLFRCHCCAVAFCEDCLDFDKILPMGDTLPELQLLGYGKVMQAYFIRCAECVAYYNANPDKLAIMEKDTEQNRARLERGESDYDEKAEAAALARKQKALQAKSKNSHKTTIKKPKYIPKTPSRWVMPDAVSATLPPPRKPRAPPKDRSAPGSAPAKISVGVAAFTSSLTPGVAVTSSVAPDVAVTSSVAPGIAVSNGTLGDAAVPSNVTPGVAVSNGTLGVAAVSSNGV
ncbi:P-loop containing nucleoside triphosphate hydrolase protein [Phlyctochytrium arcticum]|nr:P-loop containing nucleoside triphosphate hydrolase protein [Phlyctochytrium arcticum]